MSTRSAPVDPVDEHDQHTTDVLTELTYVGVDWHTTADAVLANTAAARQRTALRGLGERLG